jgi:hypothetical protein
MRQRSGGTKTASREQFVLEWTRTGPITCPFQQINRSRTLLKPGIVGHPPPFHQRGQTLLYRGPGLDSPVPHRLDDQLLQGVDDLACIAMLQFLLLHCYPEQAGCSPFAVHSLARPYHTLHGMGKVQDPHRIRAIAPLLCHDVMPLLPIGSKGAHSVSESHRRSPACGGG